MYYLSQTFHLLALLASGLYLLLTYKTVRSWISHIRPKYDFFCSHLIARLVLFGLALLGFGQDLGRGGIFLWFGVALEIIAWPLSSKNQLVRNLVILVTTFLLFVSTLLGHLEGSNQNAFGQSEFGSFFLALHIVPALLGESFLLLVTIAGGLYLIQSNLLKKRKVDLISSRLPNLQTSKGWIRRFSLIGLIFMSVSILVGLVAYSLTKSYEVKLDLSVLNAFLSWLILLVIVVGEKYLNISIRTCALIAVISVPTLLLGSVWLVSQGSSGGSYHQDLNR